MARLNCRFCGYESTTGAGRSAHERYCEENPNRGMKLNGQPASTRKSVELVAEGVQQKRKYTRRKHPAIEALEQQEAITSAIAYVLLAKFPVPEIEDYPRMVRIVKAVLDG